MNAAVEFTRRAARLPPPDADMGRRRIIGRLRTIPFIGIHAACLGVFWTGVSANALALCAVMYAARMFAITGGYHRYFAHRSYRTSRAFQFVLACLGCAGGQKGPLWWAAWHRHHHGHSDEDLDAHSPDRGFWWSHCGWFLGSAHDATDYDLIRDFARYPELRWLNDYWIVPPAVLAVGCLLLMGGQGLVWGFFVSTVLLHHCTFAINSLSHMFGSVRYETGDRSRNSFLLALITFGEGWHNNHHYYATSTRMGFLWWQLDVSYYALKLLSLAGVVWDLKEPPPLVVARRVVRADRLGA
jgi:stearoyl-CoA desaturase (delta-9 desaturase)